ncbi:aminomethyltransferase [Malassezia vespertilionis]|uniref:Aminomethyltransferase n=1 Tax=Malassezia vespertilionis TaxID=2020962 RepID=A0A2N1J8L3_9BASI|nr:aminomethyltransferase [Malassezia vespertilionis]PKI82876.1 Gcv1p [Malassezia vespertilionis]WFD08242.1 aminomethyltransferase [Malassezia vespertilionis]
MLRAVFSPRLAGSGAVQRACGSSPLRFFSSARACAAELNKTGLHAFHRRHGAKLVPFGGYSMPLSYSDVGQIASHHHVRSHTGLFDVGHMVQHMFEGPGALRFLQHLTPASLQSLEPFSSTLSVLMSPSGGILDDLIITKHTENKFYVVTNAGRRDEDLQHFAEQKAAWEQAHPEATFRHNVMEEQGLIALQGPTSASVLASVLPHSFDLAKLTFGRSAWVPVAVNSKTNETVLCHVARAGYTGEDGFEISVPPGYVDDVATALIENDEVQLAGLAARDSLRLEAGMCLYGHDLDESVSPIEGGLAWTVGKDRRADADFLGAERVLKELKEGPQRRRVGFTVTGGIAREGAKIFAEDGTTEVGKVTSGIPSPTLGKNIAMGYVKNGYHKKDTPVKVEIRGKPRDAVVTRMPFVPNKFYRGP